MKVRLLSRDVVKNLVSVPEIVRTVEEAFRAKGSDKAQMPMKSYVFFEDHKGDFRTMPAYIKEKGAAGVKIVNVHPRNPEKHDLPSVMATVQLLDPRTGAPLSIMDGTLITKLRTGGAGAVAAKYLASKDADTVGIIGAGAQGRTQLEALNEVIDIDEVFVKDKIQRKSKEFANEMEKKLDLDIFPVQDTKEAVLESDVVVTVTPREKPIIDNEWISEGMHINAIGADAPEKQELDPRILNRSKIIVDDLEQATHSGEISIPLSEGKLLKENIYGDIGEILVGKKKGRSSNEDITIFDSTGLAVQDIACAWEIYQKAEKRGLGKELDLLQL